MLLGLMLLVVLPTASAQEFGTNWTATFFNTPDLSGPVVATQVGLPGINFNWGTGSPVPGAVNVDEFSARFTSTQQFADGTYEFIVTSDDGVRMFIDGVLVIDEFVPRPLTTNTFSFALTAGSHSLTVEYFENIDEASVSVQWFLSGTGTVPEGAVPVGGGEPVQAGLTAQVDGARVSGLALRTGPYLGATIIGVVTPGNTYNVLARNNDEGVFTWYLLDAGGRQGWSSGRFLQLTGDENIVPEQGSVFDTLDNPPDTGVTVRPRAVMNLRRRPSVRTQRIGSVPWGATVPLLGRTVQGGNFWLLVRYEGQVGWIFAPFVDVPRNLDAVPVY